MVPVSCAGNEAPGEHPTCPSRDFNFFGGCVATGPPGAACDPVRFQSERQFDKTGRLAIRGALPAVSLTRLGRGRAHRADLHDVVEKAPGWTLDRLREEGFSSTIVDAVDALTRRLDEAEDDFIRRVSPIVWPDQSSRPISKTTSCKPSKLVHTQNSLLGLEIIVQT